MGPPSRYNIYAAAHARAQATQDSEVTYTEVDTASLSNAQLAEHHLKLLATATTPEELSSRMAAAFSRSINITMNGLNLSQNLYAQQWGTSFGAPGTMTFGCTMETPDIRIPMFRNASVVSVSYDAKFTGVARSGREQLSISVTSNVNLIIADDKTVPSSASDRRRIVSINQVLVDKGGLLTFPLRNV